MGLGSVMGSALAGYQASANDRLKKEAAALASRKADRNDEYMQKQMEVMDYNMKAKKAEMAAANSPEAKQLRAMKIKMETEMLKGWMGDASSGSTGAAQQQETANKQVQMQQQMEDTQAQTMLKDTITNMYTDISDGGQISSDQVSLFNKIIQDEPGFQVKFPNGVEMFNPNNEKHKQGIKAAARKTLEVQGIDITKFPVDKADELLEDVEKSLEKMGEVGYALVDPQTGDLKLIDELVEMTDVRKTMPTSLIKATKDRLAKSIEAVTMKNAKTRKLGLNDVPEWKKADGTDESKGPLLYKGKNASEETAKRKYFGLPIPPELEAVNKHNSSLINPTGKQTKETGYWAGASQEQLQEAIPNQMDKLMELEPGSEEYDDLKGKALAGIDSMEDSEQRKNYRKAIKKAEQLAIGKSLVFKPQLSTGEQTKIEVIENTNIEGNSKLRDSKDKILAETTLITGINDVMEDIVEVEEGAGMLNGAMTSDMLMQAISIAPDKAEELLSALNGTDRKAMRAAINNTIAVNSKIGKLLATYIKNTSGATVGDKERDFLVGILQGARGGDSRAMIRSMTAFREASGVELAERTKDMELVAGIPATIRRVNTIVNSVPDYQTRVDAAIAKRKKVAKPKTGGAYVPSRKPPEGM